MPDVIVFGPEPERGLEREELALEVRGLLTADGPVPFAGSVILRPGDSLTVQWNPQLT